ncbi:fused response regulator/phosphatase, partial [Streptomyces sp. NPDC056132]
MTSSATAFPDVRPGEPVYRVLLIEDDEGDALLVEELLHDTGLRFELTTRTSLADSRADLTAAPFDC